MSDADCQQSWKNEIVRFETLLFVSLILTLANTVATVVLVRKGLPPLKLAYYHGVTGTIKVLLAISIFCIIPTCPLGCSCDGGHFSPLGAAVPLVIGMRWMARGYAYYKNANSDSAASTPETEAAVTGEMA